MQDTREAVIERLLKSYRTSLHRGYHASDPGALREMESLHPGGRDAARQAGTGPYGFLYYAGFHL